MTQTFRFIGAITEVKPNGPRLTKLGETFQADPADVFCAGGIPALPVADFDEIFEDVPAETLAQYAHAETRRDPPKNLADAIAAASIKLHQLRGGQ